MAMFAGAKVVFALTATAAGATGAAVAGEPVSLHRLLPGHHAPAPSGAGCSTAVGRAVCSATRDPHIHSAMLLGALLEGGNLTGPWACGDGGWSCGPWQINRSVHHSVSRAEAQDPRFAAAYMLPAYTAGCRAVPVLRWRTDPRAAAAECAYRAERPARMYPTARVNAAWTRLGGTT